MNILMIEDDKELCETVAFRLEQEGFSVDVCHDGEEGLYYMQESIHDLVILDRMLPHMDGVTLLKEARSRQIKTPVIFLTALGELNDKVAGLNCGADDYMIKPFAFEELLARIRCLLRRPGTYEASSVLNLGDISFDPHTQKAVRPPERMYPFQQRRDPFGSIPAQSRPDPSPFSSSHPRMGTGQRRGGRQPGQLRSFSPPPSENSRQHSCSENSQRSGLSA